MYPVVYSIFYLLSLLPLRVLYILSDGIYGILYYIIGYRKKVVRQNLLIAFPEKSDIDIDSLILLCTVLDAAPAPLAV
jgi:KDO2-lipid IV(A) lauroyltransferase